MQCNAMQYMNRIILFLYVYRVCVCVCVWLCACVCRVMCVICQLSDWRAVWAVLPLLAFALSHRNQLRRVIWVVDSSAKYVWLTDWLKLNNKSMHYIIIRYVFNEIDWMIDHACARTRCTWASERWAITCGKNRAMAMCQESPISRPLALPLCRLSSCGLTFRRPINWIVAISIPFRLGTKQYTTLYYSTAVWLVLVGLIVCVSLFKWFFFQ